MKLIPSESGLANSIEKREFSIENTCDKLPTQVSNIIKIEQYQHEVSKREIGLWKTPDNLTESDIDVYVNNLKNKGYREDQALLALQCNNYDIVSAYADICQYRPKIGLFELDVIATAEKISRIMINIRKSGLKRKRCFRQIQSKFPNYTVGEILHFYMCNKLKIKRRMAKYKKQFTKLSKIPSEEEFEKIVSKCRDKPDEKYVHVLLEHVSPHLTPFRPVKGPKENECAHSNVDPLDSVWNRQEVYSFFQALGMFGDNFLLISRYVGNKSEHMVKLFYAQHVKNAV